MFSVAMYESLASIPNLDLLLDLMREQLQGDGNPKPPPDIRSSLDRALRPGGNAFLIVLAEEEPTEPLGFAFCNIGSGLVSGGDYVWLNELHVAAKARGQGGGRAVMDFLIDWARQHGVKGILGVCGVENRGAQAFYQRLGFETGEVVWISKTISAQE